jgi:hypothetical protein
MSEGERPVPKPRPRQLKSTDETDRSSKVYENYTLPTVVKKTESLYDNLNAQLNDLKADAVHRPVPTPRGRTTITPKSDYENSPKPLNNDTETSPSRTTGAIRKVPNIPSVKNNFDDNEPEDRSQKDADVLSQTSSTSGKSDSKFTTPSPG